MLGSAISKGNASSHPHDMETRRCADLGKGNTGNTTYETSWNIMKLCWQTMVAVWCRQGCQGTMSRSSNAILWRTTRKIANFRQSWKCLAKHLWAPSIGAIGAISVVEVNTSPTSMQVKTSSRLGTWHESSQSFTLTNGIPLAWKCGTGIWTLFLDMFNDPTCLRNFRYPCGSNPEENRLHFPPAKMAHWQSNLYQRV